jgi:hypothetical protein
MGMTGGAGRLAWPSIAELRDAPCRRLVCGDRNGDGWSAATFAMIPRYVIFYFA